MSLVREGDAAPGAGSGFVFKNKSGNPFGQYLLNNDGRAAFTASFGLAGDDSSSNFGLWAEDPSGGLALVLSAGEAIEVAPGDFRTLSSQTPFVLALGAGVENGDPTYFNDAGQIAFRASFTDGSAGIFLASFGDHQVPEPRAVLLIGLGLAGLAWSRRRR